MTMGRWCFGWVMVVALGWPLAAAAEDKIYTLQDCFQAALKRSETLADQWELVAQAEEHYHQAVGSVLPNISGLGTYGWQDNTNGVSLPGGPNPIAPYQVKVTASQPLFRGFREYAALRQTGVLITAQKEAWQWASIQLYLDVSRGFYNVLSFESDLQHFDAQIQLYAQRIRDLQARVRIGRSRPTEVLTVQAAQATLKAQRQQTQGQWATAREILAFLTGLDRNIRVQDPETMPAAPAPEETYLKKLEDRPDIKAARQQVVSAREGVTIASGAHWPNLDASGDYYFAKSDMQTAAKWDATISLTLPIFMGGIISSQARVAESQRRMSENNLSLVLRQDEQDLRTFYDNLSSDLAQVAADVEAADVSEQNYQAVLKDYNYGLVTNLDVLVAMSSSQDALRALDRSRYTAKLDNVRLEAAAMLRAEALGGDPRP